MIFRINEQSRAGIPINDESADRASLKVTWWHRWPTWRVSRLTSLLIPESMIALLEILYMRSEQHRGIATVPRNE